MREFSFFEVFLCCAGSEAESASERPGDNSNEHERRAQTWFFRTYLRSKDGKTFSVLNARKKQLDTSLATASVITWAFADTAGLKSKSLDGVYIEGFVHTSTAIRLGSLKRVLPEHKMTDAGKITSLFTQSAP